MWVALCHGSRGPVGGDVATSESILMQTYESALHVAAQNGHLGVVDTLLAIEGIDVEARSWVGVG